MDISRHFIVNCILVILLLPSYGISSFLVFISGFLIDIDHYIWYALKFKDLNPKNSYIFHKERRQLIEIDRLHIFHVIEFWLLILILGIIFYIPTLIFGLVTHLIMDFSEMPLTSKNLRSTSLILWLYKNV
ncbi:hypothetical protein HYT57_00465 [Candidatus Woesearchaeota archaeon]|nr:hypothetical protein [Candidatus Woesearchaeota archaeon]